MKYECIFTGHKNIGIVLLPTVYQWKCIKKIYLMHNNTLSMAKGYNKMNLANTRATWHRQPVVPLDSDASDCEYISGVNCDISSDTMDYSGSDTSLSYKSLVELEGEELVDNLKTLRVVLARETVNTDGSNFMALTRLSRSGNRQKMLNHWHTMGSPLGHQTGSERRLETMISMKWWKHCK